MNKRSITIVLCVFIATRALMLFQLEPLISDVPHNYYSHVARVANQHLVPYRDVAIEYPPAGWWLIFAPRWVSTDSESYHHAFRVLALFCDVACFSLVLAIARLRRVELATWAALSYTLLTAGLAHLVYDRLDIALLLALLAAIYARLREHRALGYAFLGLGVSMKLIPIVAAPFWLVADWRTKRRWLALPFVIGAALPFAIQFAISGSSVFALFGHHAERGIQIESLWGSIVLLAAQLGLDLSIVHTHGAYEVISVVSPVLKVVSTSMLLLFLLMMGVRALRSVVDDVTALWVIAACVILANVFSPQYLLWALPLLLLVALERLSPKQAWLFLVPLAIVVALTTWIFPYNYIRSTPSDIASAYGLIPDGTTYTSPAPLACIALALRNAIYCGAIAWLKIAGDRAPSRSS